MQNVRDAYLIWILGDGEVDGLSSSTSVHLLRGRYIVDCVRLTEYDLQAWWTLTVWYA